MAKTPLPLEFEKELVPAGAKAVMKSAQATSRDQWMVPIEYLHVMPNFNVRVRDSDDYKRHRDTIKESIKQEGFYGDKPLAGYIAKEGDESYIYVTDGHTRLEAAQEAIAEGAPLTALPVVIKPAGTSLEDLTVALVRSNSGKPLTPLELGVVCHRLVKMGWDEQKIAEKLSVTRRYVTDLLTLVGAPAAIRAMVQNGKASATLAIETLREHGSAASKVLREGLESATRAGKERVTGRHLEKPAKPRQEKPAGQNDFLLAALDYAIGLGDGAGIGWLRRWRHGEDEALAELEAHMGQPEGATNDPTKRVPLAKPADEPPGELSGVEDL